MTTSTTSTSPSDSSSFTNVQRRPTLAYPSLHLGSFDNLATSLALPSSPSRQSHRSLRDPGPSSRVHQFQQADLPRLSSDDAPKRSNESTLNNSLPASNNRAATDNNATSTSPLPRRPTLPPPSMSLPALPSLSPISPFLPTHHGLPAMPLAATLDSLPVPPSIPAPRPSSRASSSGIKQPQPPLIIDIPRTLTPPPIVDDLPTIRDSPSIARRRTVLPASPHASRIPSGRATQVVEEDDASLERRKSIESGSISMPVARPTPMLGSSDIVASPHRLEKKASVQDLKASPTSPTPKRSLPRPPSNRTAPPPLNLQVNTQPPPRTSNYQTADLFTTQPTRHVPTKSASSIPVVGGLADAGPYASAAPRAVPGPAPAKVGLGRPPPRQVQEEVCIECMMRDRDLADVTVSGEGVWERKSDACWEDLKSREEELLRSLGSEHGSVPSLDHSLESDDDDSLPSTNHSDDPDARRRMAARMGRREQRRARRKQVDWRIAHEVGWRGFKWEEGAGGEGLPEGFRGMRGGPLTEDGIKAVMTKFPSASALRAKNLDNYLYHQAILIREIRAEAQRLGRYPMPGEERHSVLSLDGLTVLAGPRSSSVAWEQKHARDLSERTSQQHVKPSPSSPADLAGIAGRPQQVPTSRPQTHFYPDREPAAQRSPMVHTPSQRSPIASAREYNRRSVNSTKTVDRSMRTDIYGETDDEMWPPISPAESGLRPFSFAVRAGATAGRSSDGHNQRKSILGRWGGSVTSFFGGSQGGSGSMMDMHLGLDQDKNNRASSNFVHGQPRAVSLASPTRPAFFDKNSRASSVHGDVPPRRVKQSRSTSRLSQMLAGEDNAIPPSPSAAPEKKKGLKGFLKKMKPKGHKKSASAFSAQPSPRPDDGALAPPPPMAHLVNGSKQNGRDRSGSTSSALTDNSGPRGVYGGRSFSAPQAASSSGGSQSASPTSSRYRRESYASVRDQSDAERRGSAMEMLARQSAYEGSIAPYPPHAFRPHTSSFSNSSLLMPTVETPPPGVNGANAFFAPQPVPGAVQTSPNRYKSLPPLPPVEAQPLARSPDSLHTTLVDGSRSHHSKFASSPRVQGQPRASFDPLTDPRQRLNPPTNPRLAQSMYAQPTVVGSAGSFGGDWPPPQRPRADDGRSVKSRKGLKSFFGGARAGRVA